MMHVRQQNESVGRDARNPPRQHRNHEHQNSQPRATGRLPFWMRGGHWLTACSSSQSLPSGAMRCAVSRLPDAGSEKAASTSVLSEPMSVL